jgi:thymidylate synthase ThyX
MAVLANVGVTINARALEHALVKMLSHPLEEVRRIGGEIKACAVQSIPTLLKYADADEYLVSSTSPLQLNQIPVASPDSEWCKLIYSEPDAEARILAAYMYRLSNINYTQALNWVQHANSSEKAHLADLILNSQDPHSIPLRELEHATFTFDVQLDQGAFYEVKRHRMMTLTSQTLTAQLGYALPKAIVSAGQEKLYCAAMAQAQTTYQHLAQEHPNAASYIVPNAYNRRFLITANFRSLIHFIRLRSAPNAHFSVRRFAQCLTQDLSSVLPSFAAYFPNNHSESVASVESAFFSETMRV